MVWSAAAAAAFHLLLAVGFAPLSEEIPLVRHIGYRGQMRILPEISVLREPGEVENELERVAGFSSGSVMEVITIEIVDGEIPAEGPKRVAMEESEPEAGDDVITRLESSLPQPTSSEMVIERLVKPLYPASSIEAGVEGVVTFRLHVAKTGEVRRAWVLDSEVDEACILEAYRAVTRWKFEPYVVNGRPTPILVDQRIRFRLRDALLDAREARGR
jgi:TonB family protein